MTPATGPDLACFGYLAFAQVTAVAAYPPANSGAQVVQVFPSLAGDAPITALTARQLGNSVHLISNRVSLDPAGRSVVDMLDTARVTHQAVPERAGGLGTPQLTIVTDDAGTRTWFAWLGNAIEQLSTVDLRPLTIARLAYIDCYRILDTAAAHAITESRAPLLLNLGGDPLSDSIAHAAAGHSVAFVQTNLSETEAQQAEHVAAQLFDRLRPQAVVITLGRLGAFCRTASDGFHADAPQVPVRHTHGAGAAFSGGLAHTHLAGASAREAVRAACLIGTAHCASKTATIIPAQRLDPDQIKEPQP